MLLPKWKAFQTVIFLERVSMSTFIIVIHTGLPLYHDRMILFTYDCVVITKWTIMKI